MRGATGVYPVKCHTCDFNPRTPRGVRRGAYTHTVWFSPYFNPRAPCGARQGDHLGGTPLRTISIHAPRAGRDRQVLQCPDIVDGISIHAPRAGRDGGGSTQGIFPGGFQSTRPVRGATAAASACACVCKFQSTRPVRGATLFPFRCGPPPGHFNPRAPCGARQQKYTKLLYTLLRQKAIFRQFHAKRRLLKRFSTYKYRNTFLICSANRMGKICTLPLRTTRSLDLPEGMSACSQSARFCFRTFFPSSKTADYPAPDP